MVRIGELFGAKPNPIGVHFGRNCLRLAQVAVHKGHSELVAVASAEVPKPLRRDPLRALDFYRDALRGLFARGAFRGRQVVLAAPAAHMAFQHLRLPPADEKTLKRSLLWEAADKLPMPAAQATLRHLIAGEVHRDGELQSEVIVMATRTALVEGLLRTASRAKLEVVGMNVEPLATIDCHARLLQAPEKRGLTRAFVDIGSAGTRIYIVHRSELRFTHQVQIDGSTLHETVNEGARPAPLHAMAGTCEPGRDGHWRGLQPESEAQYALALRTESAFAHAPSPDAPRYTDDNHASASETMDARAESARRAALARLARELEMCLRYHETNFPSEPVTHLILLGDEAANRSLCQKLAQAMGLPASLANPLTQLDAVADTVAFDPAVPPHLWTVAIGLSLGAAHAERPGALATR